MRVRRVATGSVLIAAVAVGSSGCSVLPYYLMPGARDGSFSGGTATPACSSWSAAMGAAPGTDAPPGESSPLAAVLKWSLGQQGPQADWTMTAHGVDGDTFASGPVTVHVVQLPDGTWFADRGSSCGDLPGAYSESAAPSPAP
jgi:hypothetical protein